MSNLRPILLVEDNPKDLELTLEALERSQLANEVVTARDGVEALDWLFRRNNHADRDSTEPTVILLDLKLPRVDGLQVLEQIKKSEELRHLPVVMLTASREESDLIKSYQLGVNAFVVKPVGFQEFFNAIRDLGIFWALVNEPSPPPRSTPMKVTPA
jgi:CheY-like chemotaxis protein